jgi:enoyl-CoA hydratase
LTGTNDLLINKRDSILTISFNRPEKRNLVTPEMLDNLRDTLNKVEIQNEIRCVIIRGEGHKAFSSGYDINSIGDNDMIKNHEGNNHLPQAARSIEDFPCPVIALINGHAFGAGLELAISCDYRVCVDSAKLGMPPAKLGVLYSFTGIRKFLNLIGSGYTKEMFLIGNPFDAEKAEKVGMVNIVKSKDEIEKYTYNLAKEISENAPLSMKTMKYTINKWQQNQNLADQENKELINMILEVQNSSDYKEGLKAFTEKRKPRFSGKWK